MSLLEFEFLSPLTLSIKIAFISVGIVLIFGVLFGRFLAKKHFKGKLLIETILLLPIVLPPTVIGFLLIFVFGHNSLIGLIIEKLFSSSLMFTSGAAVISSTVVAFPLMYQTVKNGFESVDKDIEEAARVDGANEVAVFLFITLPLSFRFLITGVILSFARAFGEFGATFMFAGNIVGKTQTAPIAIYVAMESGNMRLAWLLVITMILISSLMLLATNSIKK